MSAYQISDADLDELEEQVWNDDTLIPKLISFRGGCSCHISPPCAACCSPLTAEEAIDLGIYEEPQP